MQRDQVEEVHFRWAAPGSCRLYDKRLAIKKHIKVRRRSLHERWTTHGWDGAAAVVRVEFSYNYPTLLDMGVEGPYDLLRALPVIWRYATHETLRYTIPAPGTPCAERARWRMACGLRHVACGYFVVTMLPQSSTASDAIRSATI